MVTGGTDSGVMKLVGRTMAGSGLSTPVVGIAPCVWGAAADGLRPPPRVRLDGNYTSIKRVNSTHGHWGVMALWQMRGAYAG